MARGFLSGALLGGVVSVGVAGVASVIAPLRDSTAPEGAAVQDSALREDAGAPTAGNDSLAEVETTDEAVEETTAVANGTEPEDRSPADATAQAESPPSMADGDQADTTQSQELPADSAQTATDQTDSASLPQQDSAAPKVSTDAPGAVVAPAESTAPESAPLLAGESDVQTENAAVPLTAPDADTLGTIQTTTIQNPAVAQPSVIAGLDAPAAPSPAGQVAPSEEDPVFPNPQALAPMLPQSADPVVIDTAPAARPLPTTVAPQDAETDTGPNTTETAEAPEDPGGTPQTGTTAETAPKRADGLPALTPSAPQDAPQTADTEETAPANAPAATQPDTEQDAPQVASLAPSARPQIGTPAISLTDRSGDGGGVRIRRLGAASEEPTDVTIITEEGATPGRDPRPIAQYGQPFSNPDNKPLMSIVLIDNGTSPTSGAAGIAALRSFPYALSFAVDSSLPDATERMQLYRAAGFEVLAMIDLPRGAQPSDVETTLGVTLAQMREVVGVLEGPGEGLQGGRAVSDQVTAILAQSGHGLVTQDKGLNTMPKLARKEGVPADPIFRDFDSKGQSATVIRRFLDQAAFKAGQEGAVIMLGRLRPDTVTALLLWGLQDRAGTVAIAPISAALRREEG